MEQLIYEESDFKEFLDELAENTDFDKDILEGLGTDLAIVAQNKFDCWLSNQKKLYGRHDDKDGWEFHEKPGDMDTHICRAFGFEEIKETKLKCPMHNVEGCACG
jgi:hypothetical protein